MTVGQIGDGQEVGIAGLTVVVVVVLPAVGGRSSDVSSMAQSHEASVVLEEQSMQIGQSSQVGQSTQTGQSLQMGHSSHGGISSAIRVASTMTAQ